MHTASVEGTTNAKVAMCSQSLVLELHGFHGVAHVKTSLKVANESVAGEILGNIESENRSDIAHSVTCLFSIRSLLAQFTQYILLNSRKRS